MTVNHQPPVDKPQATHTREMEHLLFDQLIQLGEDRAAFARLFSALLGSIWPSGAFSEMI